MTGRSGRPSDDVSIIYKLAGCYELQPSMWRVIGRTNCVCDLVHTEMFSQELSMYV